LPAYTYDDSGSGGAVIEIHRPRFTPTGISNQYFIKITDYGSIYYDDYPPIVIPGGSLGGITGTNDAVIRIKYADAGTGKILVCSVSGIAIGEFTTYYVYPLSATQLRVYEDVNLTVPVLYDGFAYDGSGDNYMYVPEPLFSGGGYKYVANAIVSYNNRVWRCIESNSDIEFDYAKWEEVKSDDRILNALDRIKGYYQPTPDMVANDLRQLVSGTSYPNNIYYGNDFAPEDVLPLDFELRDEAFYPRDSNIKGITARVVRDEEQNILSVLYVAVGDSSEESFVLTSTDGENWTFNFLSKQSLGVTDITWSGDYFVISTTNLDNPIFISTDGYNWYTTGSTHAYDFIEGFDVLGFDTVQVTTPKDSLYSVMYSNEKYVAVGKDILTSDNAVTWTQKFNFGSRLSNTIKAVIYASVPLYEGYIAVGSGDQVVSGGGTAAPSIQNNTRIITSANGEVWEARAVPFTTKQMNAIMSSTSQGRIVTAGEDGEIWYTETTNNWLQTTSIIGDPVTSTFRDGLFVERTWTMLTLQLFFLVGDDGTILTSSDGITWNNYTNPILTTENLNGISLVGDHVYVVGENGTILRTYDGITWENVSYITKTDPFYTVKGSDFLFGYGPEEMVPGVVTDTLSMTVHTTPGAAWDKETISQDFLYEHTGFNMKSKVFELGVGETEIDFSGIVQNPAQISVYTLDVDNFVRIYPTTGYVIDSWIDQTIVLDPSLAGSTVLVEVYEIGNGQQMVRSNNQDMPMTVNNDGNSEILLNVPNTTLEIPIVYHNGTRLEYLTDYNISVGSDNNLKIDFATLYDESLDYITFAIIADSTDDFNTNHYGYSIPETEVFVYDGSTTVFSLSNYVSPDEPDNAVVELNGVRLIPTTDYTVDYLTSELTVTASLSMDDVIAVTTFNDTQRQYLKTDYFDSGNSSFFNAQVTYVDNTVTPVRVITTTDLSIADTYYEFGVHTGDMVRIDGLLGSTELNGLGNISGDEYHKFFAYSDPSYTGSGYAYRLNIVDPADDTRQIPLNGDLVSNYISGGYMCKQNDMLILTNTIINLENGVGDPYTIVPKTASRVWTTVNGERVDPENLRIYDIPGYADTAFFNILVPVDTTASDKVITTSMISSATPNESTFNIQVNKTGTMDIYTFNVADRTWLAEDLIISDDVVYLKDAARAIEPGSNMLQINGEKIRFTDIDYIANTVSGLTRGIEGTGVSTLVHPKNSYVYGLSAGKRLATEYYNKTWNTEIYTSKGDPQQFSETVPARFL
jgi:hypothetical protein